MYAKSYIAFDGSAGARTAQTTPDNRYTCHSSSVLQYHPEYITERPWFEHRPDD